MKGTQFPNGAIVMEVDVDVQEVLAQSGCLAELQETPGRNWIAYRWQTEDAYLFATHDYGHPQAIDNGYTLVILPKSSFTEAEACSMFTEFTDDHCLDTPQYEEMPQPCWN